MLILKNAEGSKFNPKVDNYLVVTLQNQRMEEISYEQLEWLVEVTSNFHLEPLVVEVNADLKNVVDYLVNIEVLFQFNKRPLGRGYYYTVQRNMLN